MSPPLRTNDDITAIIEGLADGTIDAIATDHAPHTLNEKDVPLETAPNGIIGLETAVGVALTHLYHTKKLDLMNIVKLFSTQPRAILGVDEIIIEEGQKANFTIFAPNQKWTVDKYNSKSKSMNTPYHNVELIGIPKYTINNNKIFKSELK